MRLLLAVFVAVLVVLAAVGGAPDVMAQSAKASGDAPDCGLVESLGNSRLNQINKDKGKAVVREIQAGLLAVYSDAELLQIGVDDPQKNLTDGNFRGRTAKAFAQLCYDFPVEPQDDDLKRWEDLFESSEHFGKLLTETSRDWRNWVTDSAAVALFRSGGGDRGRLLRLRLAGTPQMVATLLNGGKGLMTQPLSKQICEGAANQLLDAPERGKLTSVLGQILDRTLDGESEIGAGAVEFCQTFATAKSRVNAAEDTLAALRHFDELLGSDPEAIRTIGRAKFGAWVTRNVDEADSDKDRIKLDYNRLLRLAGSGPVILELLRDARLGLGPEERVAERDPPPDGLPAPCGPGRSWRYYQMTTADVADLVKRADYRLKLEKLQGAAYTSVAEAVAAVHEIVPRGNACRDAVIAAAVENVEAQNVFQLNAAALKTGEPATWPSVVRDTLEKLAADQSDDEAALKDVITEQLAAALRTERDNLATIFAGQVADRAIVEKKTEAPPSAEREGEDTGGDAQSDKPQAVVSEFKIPNSIQSMIAGAGVPAAVLVAVEAVDKGPYSSLEELTQAARSAITIRLAASPDYKPETYLKAISAEKLIPPRQRIVLSADALDDLKSKTPMQDVSKAAQRRAEELKDVAFAEQDLFQAAVMHPDNTVTGDETAKQLSQNMAALVIAARKKPDPDEYPQALAVVPTEDCGCVPRTDGDPDDVADGRDVYGFYPFWLSPKVAEAEGDGSEKTTEDGAAPPQIDFSLYSRMAYFGVYATLSGSDDAPGKSLPDVRWNHWGQDDAAVGQFIETVHRHNSRADLGVYLDRWPDWSELDADAIDQIAEKVASRLPGEPEFWPSARTLLFSGLKDDRFLDGPVNGVTLYFPDLTGSIRQLQPNLSSDDWDKTTGLAEAAKRIVAITRAFRRAIDNPDIAVNIAFEMPAVPTQDEVATASDEETSETVAPFFMGLAEVLAEEQKDVDAPVKFMLVLLNRPTTDSKKRLRSALQDAFSGEARRQMLRKTIAILAANGHDGIVNKIPELRNGRRVQVLQEKTARGEDNDFGQYEDDLSFAKDNFRGVGFWPVPVAEDEHYETVSASLRQQFWPPESRLANLGLTNFETAMDFFARVCTDRVIVRTIVAAIFLAFLLLAIAPILSCIYCKQLAAKLYLPQILLVGSAAGWTVLLIGDPWFAALVFPGVLMYLALGLFYAFAFNYTWPPRSRDRP